MVLATGRVWSGDSDEETGQPLSDCLHAMYLTAEAIGWLGAQPAGGFQLQPMVSDDRSILAPRAWLMPST